MKKMDSIIFLDITKKILEEKNIEDLFSENTEYGGHYSKEEIK